MISSRASDSGAKPGAETRAPCPGLSFLPDHRIDGNVIFPGAGYVEAALALGLESTGAASGTLEDIEFHKALFLDSAGRDPVLHLEYDPVTSP